MSQRSDRVPVVKELRARGHTYDEIAYQLRLSRSYVSELVTDPTGEKVKARKDSYRRPCPGYGQPCGRKMDGSLGRGPNASKLCIECQRRRISAERKWTKETIIEAIHRFAAIHGRPPTVVEWRKADLKNGYPAASTVYSHESAPFEQWSDAIAAAGFPRPWKGSKQVRWHERGEMDKIKSPPQWVILRERKDGAWDKLGTATRKDNQTQEEAVNELTGGIKPGETYVILRERYWQPRTAATQTTTVLGPAR